MGRTTVIAGIGPVSVFRKRGARCAPVRPSSYVRDVSGAANGQLAVAVVSAEVASDRQPVSVLPFFRIASVTHGFARKFAEPECLPGGLRSSSHIAPRRGSNPSPALTK